MLFNPKRNTELLLLFLVIFTLINTGCKKKIRGCMDSTSINYNPLATQDDGSCAHMAIGESYQGGNIFYLLTTADVGYDSNVKHGLIAAPTDQSASKQWFNGTYMVTYATDITVGTGNSNTNSIVVRQGAGSYAAKLCSDLDLGGYNDWYLPSKDELKHLYENKSAVGGITNGTYWSSTEGSSSGAWGQAFDTGAQINYGKNLTWCVRAIRTF